MKEIGAFEAKNTLSALLDLVEALARRSLSRAMASRWRGSCPLTKLSAVKRPALPPQPSAA